MRNDLRQLTEYLKNKNYTPNSFAEIGSRDGYDTQYVSNYWGISPSKCYIFEPHPYCYNFIKSHFPLFNVFDVAISNETSPLSFNAIKSDRDNNIGASSVLKRNDNKWDSDLIKVDGWRMDDIIQHLNIPVMDLIKIDVEGLGLEVIESFGKYLPQIHFIQIESETQEVWESQTLYKDIVEFLKNNNFEIEENIILSHNQNDTLFRNKKI